MTNSQPRLSLVNHSSLSGKVIKRKSGRRKIPWLRSTSLPRTIKMKKSAVMPRCFCRVGTAKYHNYSNLPWLRHLQKGQPVRSNSSLSDDATEPWGRDAMAIKENQIEEAQTHKAEHKAQLADANGITSRGLRPIRQRIKSGRIFKRQRSKGVRGVVGWSRTRKSSCDGRPKQLVLPAASPS